MWSQGIKFSPSNRPQAASTPVSLRDDWASACWTASKIRDQPKKIEGKRPPGSLQPLKYVRPGCPVIKTSPPKAGFACAADRGPSLDSPLRKTANPARGSSHLPPGGTRPQGLLGRSRGPSRGRRRWAHHPMVETGHTGRRAASSSLRRCRCGGLKQLELCAGRRERKGSQGWGRWFKRSAAGPFTSAGQADLPTG